MSDFDPAWEEAEASAPHALLVFETLEFQHPGFVNEANAPIPLRYVLDVQERELGIELSALFNPGELVTFLPTAMQVDLPEVAEGQMPRAKLSIDNVGRELVPYIEAAGAYAADLKVIYRSYADGDVAEPIAGPTEFVLTDMTIEGSRIEGQVTIADFGDRKVPSLIYSLNEFPGLQG